MEKVEKLGHNSPILDEPVLEELRILGDRVLVQCPKNLNSTCPRLKRLCLQRVNVTILLCRVAPLQFGFGHDTVKELECSNVDYVKRITCPKLTKLVMGSGFALGAGLCCELAFLVVKCLNLLHLEMHGYSFFMPRLSWILDQVPHLESLRICEQDG